MVQLVCDPNKIGKILPTSAMSIENITGQVNFQIVQLNMIEQFTPLQSSMNFTFETILEGNGTTLKLKKYFKRSILSSFFRIINC